MEVIYALELTDHTVEPASPLIEPASPLIEPASPIVELAQLTIESASPTVESEQPTVETASSTVEPAHSPIEPASLTVEPATLTIEPLQPLSSHSRQIQEPTPEPTQFTCLRCGYKSLHKQHLQNHLKRKIECSPILLNVSRQELLSKITVKEKRKRNENNQFKCSRCNKEYASSASFCIHNQTCKTRHAANAQPPESTVTTSDLATVVRELQREVANNKAEIERLQRNSVPRKRTLPKVTTPIINPHPIGNEDLSPLSPEFIQECLEYCRDKLPWNTPHGIENLLAKLYTIPENRNVRIVNKREQLMESKQDEKSWSMESNKNALNRMIRRAIDIIRMYCPEGIDPEKDTYLTVIYNGKASICEPVRKQLYVLLLNVWKRQ